ncbi:MAG: type I-MYXAN CRISPR-associated protein Cas6/Cmx6 [Betaproteobacteria bacterium]|nr:type I-MYXAN CRISPR-associated protein Cas6/Cmx6 [Betaproteobacteria bacterium]MDH5222952.1 type I-MYXAN CRISPR-associated protein Cas6/Cmx6 [Betaproteobacteria bacterium]MDH5352048.1 type I-MYXAN CRISPR-associated protein Cas6/Cmx6 [Betaproteobacteria bacterium]
MDEVVDAAFAIECRSLPVDHAFALSQAILAALPWFADEPQAGLHTVHGAASGAGWQRPEGKDALLQLSHRTRLVLRLPESRLQDAAALSGQTLDIAGYAMRVGRLQPRPLLRIASLFSRSVIFEDANDETEFLAAATEALRALGAEASTMLCGRDVALATPQRSYRTRSLMVTVATPAQSLALQRQGLGEARKLGCGLFIPHKDLGDLRSRADQSF